MNEEMVGQQAGQGGDPIQQILEITSQNNQMIQQIGQMLQQMIELAQGATQGGGQTASDEEALRQEAIRRLQQQQGA